MLKVRVIGIVLIKNDIAVQGIGFNRYLPIGKPEIVIQYLNRWGIDEIAVLHIDATQRKRPPTPEQVRSYASFCQVPLSIGGGISEISVVKNIIRSGADKIILNSYAQVCPDFISTCSDLCGQQSVVVSIDAKKITNNDEFMCFTHSGKKDTGRVASSFAQDMENFGAGEILLTSIDRDGLKRGYDLSLIQSVSSKVNIPLVACGGAGHPKDAVEAISSGASAVAVGNLFHFSEHSVILFKKYLASRQPVRFDSYVNYKNAELSHDGRILKKSDELLNMLRFQYISEEVI